MSQFDQHLRTDRCGFAIRSLIRRAVVVPGAVVVVAGAGLAVIEAAPAASAATTTTYCRVVDTNTAHSYPGLQAAVTAAAAGDSLVVKGTCTGTTTIAQNLTITGHRALVAGHLLKPTLNGGRQGSVLTIDSGAAVTVNTLTITGGGGTIGGGIYNPGGTLTVNTSTITGNNAGSNPGYGGGIINATISSSGFGAGGTVTLTHSTVRGNTAGDGGGIFNDGGTVTLTDSNVHGNSATAGTGTAFGGGILNQGFASAVGTVTLTGTSTVTGNTVPLLGGGIFDGCDSALNGAVAGSGGNVFGNIPDDIASSGCS